jgi:Tol biopolymer transport system component
MTRLFPYLLTLLLAVTAAITATLAIARAQASQWITYAASPVPDTSDLVVQDVVSGRAFNLSRSPDVAEQSPAWSADGESLAYIAVGDDGTAPHLCVLRLPGRERCFDPFGRWDHDPVWSPNSDLLIISTVSEPYPAQAVLFDPDTGESRVLLRGVEYSLQAAWSPDGSHIAGTSATPASSYIVIVEVASGAQRNITASEIGRDFYPSWSPDGSQIAFVSDRDGRQHIYTISAAGENERRLTSGDGYEMMWQGAWSPDGSQLVFASDHANGDFDLYLINADGSNLRPLTPYSPAFDEAPVWSPDGGQITFRSDRDGAINLYVVDVETGDLRRLTDGNDFYSNPVWRQVG